jgi:hypothetical protein
VTDRYSPELLSKLEQDYTVYAYDYSEYETPIVGQGMLSKVLAYSSPTPHAAASQSGTMITGRVQRNIKALFNKNAGPPETLEVKIKLVPVPTKLRGEYDRAMDTHRMASLTRSGSVSLESNGEGHSPVGMNSDMDVYGSQQHRGSMNSLHDMLTPNYNGSQSEQVQDPVAYGGSRPGSAMQNFPMGQQNSFDQISRPSSRNSLKHVNMMPDSGFDEPFLDDGPRKRARLMQTDWQGRSNFGAKPNSLRVAASTTASMRQFRPLIPGLENTAGLQGELGPRAPSPMPLKVRQQSFGSYSQAHSGLRNNASGASSPFPMSDANSVISDVLSPAGSSPPNNIPSSPPVFENFMDDFVPQPPSSPPMFPESSHFLSIPHDSGFQSDILGSDLPSELPPHQQANNAQPLDAQGKVKQQVAKWRETIVKNRANAEWNITGLSGPQVTSEGDVHPQPLPLKTQRALSAIGHLHAAPGKRRYRKRVNGSARPAGAEPESETGSVTTSRATPGPASHMVPQTRAMTMPVSSASTDPIVMPDAFSTHYDFNLLDDTMFDAIGANFATTENMAPSQPFTMESTPAPTVPPQAQKQINPATDLGKSIGPAPAAPMLHLAPNSAVQNRENTQGPISSSKPLPQRNPLSRRGKRPRKRRVLPRSNTWAGPSSDNDVDSPLPLTSEANFDFVDDQEMDDEESTVVETTPAEQTNGMPLASSPPNRDGPLLAPRPTVGGKTAGKSTGVANKRPTSSTGSGLVRQQVIMSQLEQAIRDGEIPKFCNNCGQIETPTWRPYWVRSEYGDGANITVGPKVGIHCVEPLSKDENGKTTTFRIYKQWTHLTTEEKEGNMYEQCILCNPCGDYLRKHGCHRPKGFWGGEKRQGGGKRGGGNGNASEKKGQQKRGKSEDANAKDTPEPGLQREGSGSLDGEVTRQNSREESATMPPPPIPAQTPARPPVNNFETVALPVTTTEWSDEEAILALERAIRESPAKMLYSKVVHLTGDNKDTPIELDDSGKNGVTKSPTGRTPDSAKSVRRLLFPSPRKDGEFKSLDESPGGDKGSKNGSPLSKTVLAKGSLSGSPFVTGSVSRKSKDPFAARLLDEDEAVGESIEDKENVAPPKQVNAQTGNDIQAAVHDDDEWNFFDFDAHPEISGNDPQALSQILKTPSKTPRSNRNVAMDNSVSPLQSRSLRRSARKNSNGNSGFTGQEDAELPLTTPTKKRSLGEATPSGRKSKTPRTPRNYVNPNFDAETGLPVTPSRGSRSSTRIATKNGSRQSQAANEVEDHGVSLTLPSPFGADFDKIFSDHNLNIMSTPMRILQSSTGLTPLRGNGVDHNLLTTPKSSRDMRGQHGADTPWWEIVASEADMHSSSPGLGMLPTAMPTINLGSDDAHEGQSDIDMWRFYEDETATPGKARAAAHSVHVEAVLKDITSAGGNDDHEVKDGVLDLEGFLGSLGTGGGKAEAHSTEHRENGPVASTSNTNSGIEG